MKIKTISFLILAMFVTSCNNQSRDLKLPSVFSDHMVLQQKSNVSFWGESNSNDIITISASWGESQLTKADNDGRWQVILPTPEAGGPYRIEVKNGEQTIVFNDVLLGEVWLASGQSNMGMILSDGIENQEEEIKNANYNDIRFFSVLEDLTGESIKQQKGFYFLRRVNKEIFSTLKDIFNQNFEIRYSEILFSPELHLPIGGNHKSIFGFIDSKLTGNGIIRSLIARQCSFHIKK